MSSNDTAGRSQPLENAYEGVEAATNFADAAEEQRYRRMVLEKSRHHADFIRRHLGEPSSVLEACCGNGRLLMALRGQHRALFGYDLAASRIAFAQRWIEEEAAGDVEVWVDDSCRPSARATGLETDLVVCITGAFGYFGALDDAQEQNAVDGMAAALRPGGSLVLELYTHPEVMALLRASRSGAARIWQEFPANDPFRYLLSSYRYDAGRRVLVHDKTFIRRADGAVDDSRRESLKIHDADSIAALLQGRFEAVHLFGDWDDRPVGDDAPRLIVLATGRQ